MCMTNRSGYKIRETNNLILKYIYEQPQIYNIILHVTDSNLHNYTVHMQQQRISVARFLHSKTYTEL